MQCSNRNTNANHQRTFPLSSPFPSLFSQFHLDLSLSVFPHLFSSLTPLSFAPPKFSLTLLLFTSFPTSTFLYLLSFLPPFSSFSLLLFLCSLSHCYLCLFYFIFQFSTFSNPSCFIIRSLWNLIHPRRSESWLYTFFSLSFSSPFTLSPILLKLKFSSHYNYLSLPFSFSLSFPSLSPLKFPVFSSSHLISFPLLCSSSPILLHTLSLYVFRNFSFPSSGYSSFLSSPSISLLSIYLSLPNSTSISPSRTSLIYFPPSLLSLPSPYN